MKTEKYYDVGCDNCGRHMSTDFHRGMASSRMQAEAWARREGFRVFDGQTLCPLCVRNHKTKAVKRKTFYEIELVNYDENNLPDRVDTVYCVAFGEISRGEAEVFCRENLNKDFESVFSIEEISKEEVLDHFDDEDEIPVYA